MATDTTKNSSLAALTLGAIGVVYGDIGTSPLYTIKEIFSETTGIPLTEANILGAISSVLWALMLVVTLKYIILVLRADNRGEGGIMALAALAMRSVGRNQKRMLLLIGAIGAALFYGDSIITPAISVLSAVEGLQIAAPSLAEYIIPISIGILVALFSFQRYGTSTVGTLFGPVIMIWFTVLGVVGIANIIQSPDILAAFNPLHAFEFLSARGAGVFLAVGAIVLAVTGAEALYADMGHFGKPAIRLAWTALVLPGLALNYLGQGALLLANPEAVQNPFYLSFPEPLLIPAVILATVATIIASQAVISGAFSITHQAMQVGLLPRMRIVHTSANEAGQIYLPFINWLLMASVVLAIITFGNSSGLAAAYGIAVTGTMLMTSVLTFYVVRYTWRYPLWLALAATGFFITIDLILFASCSIKLLHGGWFPIALGAILLVIMWTWKQGRESLMEQMRINEPKLDDFVQLLSDQKIPRVPRTAVFMVSDAEMAPQALMHNLKHNYVLHQKNLVVTVVFESIPWVSKEDRVEYRAVGVDFWQIIIHYGFMDRPNVPRDLGDCDIPELDWDPFTTSYFVNRETIVPSARGAMSKWRESLFAMMSRNAGSVVDYFRIPSNSVIELGSRIHL
jgi:KUP system potassium uptake protein